MYLWDFHHEVEGFVEDLSFCTVTDRGGEWRILYSEELYDFHYSPNIIRVFKSRRL